MTNAKKNALIVDCVKEAVAKIYPDEKVPSRYMVESTLYAYVKDAGISGLYDTILTIFNKTIEGAALVPESYWASEDNAKVEVTDGREVEYPADQSLPNTPPATPTELGAVVE